MSEKFNRANIQAKDFLRPPTESFQQTVIGLCYDMENQINSEVKRFKQRGGLLTALRRDHPKFRVGTELEIIMFDPSSNPPTDHGEYNNPNYTDDHRNKIDVISRRLLLPPRRGGLSDVLVDFVEPIGSISREIKTKPGTVDEYIEAVQKIQSWFSAEGEQEGFNPVVFSQHLHMSLLGKSDDTNPLADDSVLEGVGNGITDTYHRAIPLLRLPEDLDTYRAHTFGLNNWGVRVKNHVNHEKSVRGPRRVEGRYNNHAFASDPYLNLLINLIGIYRGLVSIGQPGELDEGYPIGKQRGDYDSKNKAYYFRTGRGTHPTYEEALEHILHDNVLPQFLPNDLILKLHGVVSQYQDIADGQISSPEARDSARCA